LHVKPLEEVSAKDLDHVVGGDGERPLTQPDWLRNQGRDIQRRIDALPSSVRERQTRAIRPLLDRLVYEYAYFQSAYGLATIQSGFTGGGGSLQLNLGDGVIQHIGPGTYENHRGQWTTTAAEEVHGFFERRFLGEGGLISRINAVLEDYPNPAPASRGR